MDRRVFHVVPCGSQWDLVHVDTGARLSHLDTKRAALEEGRRTAREHQPSQLVIHHSDGTIEDESTYRDDPYPPPG
jgi:hypothetical protein